MEQICSRNIGIFFSSVGETSCLGPCGASVWSHRFFYDPCRTKPVQETLEKRSSLACCPIAIPIIVAACFHTDDKYSKSIQIVSMVHSQSFNQIVCEIISGFNYWVKYS